MDSSGCDYIYISFIFSLSSSSSELGGGGFAVPCSADGKPKTLLLLDAAFYRFNPEDYG